MAARRGEVTADVDAEYVFDTNIFHQFGHYYMPTFAPLWSLLEEYTDAGRIISVAQARQELLKRNRSAHLLKWAKDHAKVFKDPTTEELLTLKEIFAVPHFQQLVEQKERNIHGPCADPFLIASAKCRNACLVSQEGYKPNGAKIPNVCEKLKVECINLEEFFARERWRLVRGT